MKRKAQGNIQMHGGKNLAESREILKPEPEGYPLRGAGRCQAFVSGFKVRPKETCHA
jgi:hypothetical protein